MSEQQRVALVTHWRNHESPDEYWVFEDKNRAIDWLEVCGVDMSKVESYHSPGGEHETVPDPNNDRMNYSIRVLEVIGDE